MRGRGDSCGCPLPWYDCHSRTIPEDETEIRINSQTAQFWSALIRALPPACAKLPRRCVPLLVAGPFPQNILRRETPPLALGAKHSARLPRFFCQTIVGPARRRVVVDRVRPLPSINTSLLSFARFSAPHLCTPGSSHRACGCRSLSPRSSQSTVCHFNCTTPIFCFLSTPISFPWDLNCFFWSSWRSVMH
ncbi:hypothetical protein VTI74DRAFT_2528 [Chaetomium olivicolor]